MLNTERKTIIIICYSIRYINIFMHILRVLSGFRIRLSAAAVIVLTRRCPKILMSQLFIVSFLLAMLSGSTVAATCSAESGAQRVALLELYTSEGCDSCPPADRWASALPARGFTLVRVVTLGFHVDENDLANEVTAGENRGKRLRHDFVVRELIGPREISGRDAVPIDHRFKLDPSWKAGDLHVAAFVQDERNGEMLQVLALANCR